MVQRWFAVLFFLALFGLLWVLTAAGVVLLYMFHPYLHYFHL